MLRHIGEADVLKIEDLPAVEPGKGEVRLKVEAIGLNRAEVMFRRGNTWRPRNRPRGSAMRPRA